MITFLCLLTIQVAAKCQWTVHDANSNTQKLDLSKLQGQKYSTIGADDANYEYNVSICTNELQCSSSASTKEMVTLK